VFSLGDMVVDKTMKIAGDEMDEDVANYIKGKYNILIGERTAEDIKISMGSAMPMKKEKKMSVQGRDLLTGLPKTVELSSIEVREAIMNTISQITEAVKDAIEETPPELLRDLLTSGVSLTGALIRGLDTYWSKELNIPVKIVEDPLSTVARGTAQMLDHIELLERVQKSWEELV
jgi:rod shape-determining protein MreB